MPSSLLQVVNNLFQTCHNKLGTSRANTTCWQLVNRLVTTCLQTWNNLCVFTLVYWKCKYTYENAGFCILCIDDFKILKMFIKLSKFSTIFHRETSQAPTAPPPKVHMMFLVDKSICDLHVRYGVELTNCVFLYLYTLHVVKLTNSCCTVNFNLSTKYTQLFLLSFIGNVSKKLSSSLYFVGDSTRPLSKLMNKHDFKYYLKLHEWECFMRYKTLLCASIVLNTNYECFKCLQTRQQ